MRSAISQQRYSAVRPYPRTLVFGCPRFASPTSAPWFTSSSISLRSSPTTIPGVFRLSLAQPTKISGLECLVHCPDGGSTENAGASTLSTCCIPKSRGRGPCLCDILVAIVEGILSSPHFSPCFFPFFPVFSTLFPVFPPFFPVSPPPFSHPSRLLGTSSGFSR